MINEHKKGFKAKTYPKKSTSTVAPSKPRNFVAKNMPTSGTGPHKDKKKANKQGDVKHKAKALAIDESKQKEDSRICPQCGMKGCTCAPGKCNCKPKAGYPKKKEVKESNSGGEEYNDEMSMVQNNLHTIIRCSEHLSEILTNDENMAEWAQEKIAVAKSMVVTILDYVASEHERGNVFKAMERFNTLLPYEKHLLERLNKQIK